MEEAKGPGGRPTKYDPVYCEQIIKHFEVPLMRKVSTEVATARGVETVVNEEPNWLPTFEGFAHNINVTVKTIYNWADKHPEFLQSLNRAKQLQNKFVMQMAFGNKANAAFAKFWMLNNTNYRDKVDTEEQKEIKVVLTDDRATKL